MDLSFCCCIAGEKQSPKLVSERLKTPAPGYQHTRCRRNHGTPSWRRCHRQSWEQSHRPSWKPCSTLDDVIQPLWHLRDESQLGFPPGNGVMTVLGTSSQTFLGTLQHTWWRHPAIVTSQRWESAQGSLTSQQINEEIERWTWVSLWWSDES